MFLNNEFGASGKPDVVSGNMDQQIKQNYELFQYYEARCFLRNFSK